MRWNVRAGLLRRLAPALVAIVPVLVAGAAPAAAAAPSNDDIGSATVITQLPFMDTVDMSQATWDFSTDSSSCSFSQSRSVWYTFTPAADEQVAFDPSASNDFMAIDVFTGSPGSLTRVGCGSGGFILSAAGGTQYWVMVSTFFCCASVPELKLAVYLAVPPQATISVTGGSFDRGGNATISGTLDCVGTAVPNSFNPGTLSGTVRQSVGRLSSVSAAFAIPATCSPALQWTALAQPSAGRFVGGPATVNAAARLCNIVGCATPTTTAVINL